MATLRGRVWTFGDDVSTDLLMPGAITYPAMAGTLTPAQTIPHCMAANRPGWHAEVRPGDVLVAGKNFGAGSGRPAYLPLQALGIQAVVADSIARLFYRNSINGGFLVIPCPGVRAFVTEGQELEVDVERGRVVNLATGAVATFRPLPDDSPPMQILRAGGLIPYLKARLGTGADPVA